MGKHELIPVLRVSGSHREVGAQIGRATAGPLQRRIARLDSRLIEAAEPYREVTAQAVPWVIEELEGVAEGSGTDARAVFAASVEEIADLYGDNGEGRCSDLVACPPASVDGHLWVAHINDLPPHLRP